MNILLAGLGFKNGDITFNKNQIINAIKNCPDNIDLIVFGESFLQGFDALTWNFEVDKNIAILQDDKNILDISKCARMKGVAISFGYFELSDDLNSIYSSQIFIDKFGKIISNYRRVSKGWKILTSDEHYKEGKTFLTFNSEGKTILIALCGDLWYEENITKINSLNPDVILWPSYTDFNYEQWNNSTKYEYAKQSNLLNLNVLYVNSYCLDKEDFEIARGGAIYFKGGKIIDEIPSGKEETLVISL